MMKRTPVAIVLLMLALGPAGCSGDASPTVPSATSVSPRNPQSTAIQPIVTAIAPNIGSTRGGAWATITGADFQTGAQVSLGGSTVPAWVLDSARIFVDPTTVHAAGAVDVVVTNPGGLQAALAGGYTYRSPESFDFNGDWIAHAGPDYEQDMRFTIRNDVLVSVSCDASGPLTFTPPPSVRNGEFSFLGSDGLAISGTLVSPVNAVGTINVPSCPAAIWWADKSGEAEGAYPRR